MNKELIQSLLDKASTLIKEYSPDALALAYSVVRVETLNNILYSITAIVIGLFIVHAGKTKAKKLKEEYKHTYLNQECIDASIVRIITASVGYCIFIIGLMNFIDIWNWITLYDPSLYLAYSLFLK